MVLEPRTSKTRILVVDDHAISGYHAVVVLRQLPGEVRRAGSAAEALKLALEWLPHVICMDYHLPDGSGTELIRQIRNQWPAERPGTRILVMTGDLASLDPIEMVRLHVEHWLEKPVSGHQLAELVFERGKNRINEEVIDLPAVDLPALFKQELQQRLPELDDAICQLNRAAVAKILHQLIASAAICREPKLESSLRSLDARWRTNSSSAEIASLYHSVLELSRELIAGKKTP